MLLEQTLQTRDVLVINELWVDQKSTLFSCEDINCLHNVMHLAIFDPLSRPNLQENVLPQLLVFRLFRV